jgi:glycerophosphoryl diester phosphodiesterase
VGPPTTERAGRFLIAHRAANDLDELRRAEALGVDAVEADVRLFRGRAEVRHLKTVGPVPVLWDRWRLASPFTARLSLERLLGAVAPERTLILDLKGRNVRIAVLVVQALSARPAAGPVMVCARRWSLLEPFRELPNIRAVHSVGSARQLRALHRRFAGVRLQGVSVHRSLLDADAVRHLRSRADIVMSWPVNTIEHANALAGWGVHGLISDAPGLLAGQFRAQPARGTA